MTPDRYSELVGKTVMNLQWLEALIRMFLYGRRGQEGILFPYTEGARVPETAITNYDSLDALVKKYNAIIKDLSADHLVITNEVVRIRDRLAHGRVLADGSHGISPDNLWTLYKFSPASNGFVGVTDAICLDEAMLTTWLKTVSDARAIVMTAFDRFLLKPGNAGLHS